MKIQLISIGDELLIGDVINSNAAFISSELIKNHFRVTKVSTIGDDEKIIVQEFKDALSKNDVIIVTGGLGPTHDDITRKCIAKYFNVELVLNEEVLTELKEFFKKRNRNITPSNEQQALVPKGGLVLKNKLGTAPGIWMEENDKILISLPGVPHEMKALITEEVIPGLILKRGDIKTVRKSKDLLTTGIPESYLFERLGNLDEILKGAKLAFLPNSFGVKMRVTVEETDEEKSQNAIINIEQKIRSKVGRYIYGTENDTLEEVIGRLLKDRSLTLSTAESCTGGLIAHRITNISGSSDYFERGVVTYSNGAKVEILKVNEDTIAEYGAVSAEVAKQMAEGIRAISGTDIGLATTGIMGPTGATETKTVGLVYISVCDENETSVKKFQFGDNRIINKERASQAALEMLRRHLLGISKDE
ncbi:MAG: competence/damage-inducible protein A [Ignavibacteriales bacterium]|nr:MAG: competence/damage-inducible protein A [Ignavibacteriales bacterium]